MNTEKRLLECEVSRLSGLLEMLCSDFKEIADALGCDVKDNQAMLEKITMLNAGPVTEWINCNERMPEVGDRDIWLWDDSGTPQNGYIWNGYAFVDWNEEYQELKNVTHWKPMSRPAAPEQEG